MTKRAPVMKQISDEQFASFVQLAKSYAEVSRLVKYRIHGTNYKTIKKRVARQQLSTQHFVRIAVDKILPERPDAEVFCKDSTYVDGKGLKKKLLKRGLLEYKCAWCPNTGTWREEPLTLQLDHINGVHNDNTVTNLRFLCPNCHSQTLTHSGRRFKKLVELVPCPKCQVPYKGHGKQCDKCSKYTQRRVTHRPNRTQLLKMTEELGFSAVGRKYGVSDNAIRKWLKV